jgi:putative ABC transport system permease protein
MVDLYATDSHGLNTLGLTLLSGRFLEEQEVTASSSFEDGSNSIKAVVLSRSLADKLYGKDVDPTGKLLNGLPVVGVVASAMVSYVAPGYTDGVAFIPRFATNYPPNYVIRCQPQQCEQLMVKVPELLEKLDPNRMVRNVRTMADNKHNSYRRDRSMVVMMTATIILVSAVTGLGIVGLTLLWVNQRRKQIGIRRALGATQLAIIRYFLLENVVITGIGIVVGVIISLAINQLMVQHYSMTALPVSYLLSGMVAVWLLGLLAALMPAWRTIRISPALATRNI